MRTFAWSTVLSLCLVLGMAVPTGAASTELVEDIVPGGTGSSPDHLANAGGALYFLVHDPADGRVPWVSDGTTPGTRRVADIVGRPGTSFAKHGSHVYFAAADGDPDAGEGAWTGHGFELWRTDGTPDGTSLVRDIRPGECLGIGFTGPCSSFPRDFIRFRGLLYFTVTDPIDPHRGPRLWRTDGSESGTERVWPDEPVGVEYIVRHDDLLYFAGITHGVGQGLWKSDGTPDGTHLVRHFRRGMAPIVPMGGNLYFFAVQRSGDIALWRSDGTADGTRPLKRFPIDPGAVDLTRVGDRLFFHGAKGQGDELWISDGTSRGTRLVKDIVDGPAGSRPMDLTAVRGMLFFTAEARNGADRELWVSDGTARGTTRVRDIRPGDMSSEPNELTEVGGALYFAANDGRRGRELWTSDGTRRGTRLVRDIKRGKSSSGPAHLTRVGDSVYFSARGAGSGRELWRHIR